MLAKGLRISLAFHLALAVGLFFLLSGSDAERPLATTLLVAAALEIIPIGLAGLLSRVFASPTPPGLKRGLWGGLTTFAAEAAAFFLLARVFQPFADVWLGKDKLAAGNGRPPALLVHGYVCNRGFWIWLRRRLARAGVNAATITLDPPFADIEHLAEQLHLRIETLAAEAGRERVVLVGHSMGGLVSRAYLRRFGAARVARLITLGTPHSGTRLASFGLGRNARQMEVGNAWLAELNAAPLPVPVTAVWSAHDTIVAPQDAARLPGAREIALGGLGHLAMAFSPRILAILLAELARDDDA